MRPRPVWPKTVTALALTLAGALLAPPASRGQQPPPDDDWHTLSTPHFRIHFVPEGEALARAAAARAELAWTELSGFVARPPDGPVDIVVSDHSDVANGFARVLYTNRVVLLASPPVSHPALAFTTDWLDMVLVHELAHIFHLDVPWAHAPWLRRLLGRAPIPWLVFPAVGSPEWAVEGLATLVESRFTGAGRVHGSYHEMVVRTAVLEGAFPDLSRVSGHTPIWPAGGRPYIYGSLFMDHLTDRRGEAAVAATVEETADAWLPAQLRFDAVGRAALGESFSSAYRGWRGELESRYGRLADSLRAEGVTEGEDLGLPGRYAFHPRLSAGGRLAYALDDGRRDPATVIADAASGAVLRRVRGNEGGLLLGPASWLPGGGLVTSRLDFRDPYRLQRDLWLWEEGRERRLTRGQRVGEPDASPDGRRIVAVQGGKGSNRLVLVDARDGRLRPLGDFVRGRTWSLPRWSPDGDRIAATLWRDGGLHDVVVLDTLGRVLETVTRDRALDLAPAWSPDGRWLLFSSDRTGIPDLYAHDLRSGRLWRVTRVLGGAFHPEVSPDGRWIYFAAYHADGFRIERLPFDPSTWRPAPDPSPHLLAGSGGSRPDEAVRPPGANASTPTPYSPWSTLRPHFWLPLAREEADALRVGGITAGQDVLGRHSVVLAVTADARRGGLVEAFAEYGWAGLGDPLIGVSATRDWERLTREQLDEGTAEVFLREDDVALTATFRRPRWRSFASLLVGAELARDELVLVDAPAGVGFAEGSDLSDRLVGAVARLRYGDARRHDFSISPEDGVSAALTARRRWEVDPPATGPDAGYTELAPYLAAYRAGDLGSFARHVLAARVSALWRDGSGAPTSSVGGVPGSGEATLLGDVGGGSRFLPARGFGEGARRGTRAWSASLELRVPLALVGRGPGLWPVFLDRVSGAVFLDGADAWCTAGQSALREGRGCSPETLRSLVSSGFELSLDGTLFYSAPVRLRLGLALPVRGDPDRSPTAYLQLGPSY